MDFVKKSNLNLVLIIVFLLSVVGLSSSIYLTLDHYKLATLPGICSDKDSDSVNNKNININCDKTLTSPYSYLPFKYSKIDSSFAIPVSLIGAMGYLFVLMYLIYLFTIDPERKKNYFPFLITSFLIYLGSSLFFASIMIFVLNTICPYCTTCHGINLFLFIFLLFYVKKAYDLRFTQLLSLKLYIADKKQIAIIIIFFINMILIGGLAFWGLENSKSGTSTASGEQKDNKKSCEDILKKDLGWPWLMKQTADLNDVPVLKAQKTPSVGSLVVYSDPMCTHCREGKYKLLSFWKQTNYTMDFYFKFYPMESQCNKYIKKSLYEGTCNLTYGMYAAYRLGKFWEMLELVYGKDFFYKSPKEEEIVALAEKAGMQKEDFLKHMKSKEAVEYVKKQIEEGEQVGVAGTPALLINGKIYNGIPDSESMFCIYDYERNFDKNK